MLEDRFKVIGTLGKGGFSVVYDGYDIREDQPVAIKMVRRYAFEDFCSSKSKAQQSCLF